MPFPLKFPPPTYLSVHLTASYFSSVLSLSLSFTPVPPSYRLTPRLLHLPGAPVVWLHVPAPQSPPSHLHCRQPSHSGQDFPPSLRLDFLFLIQFQFFSFSDYSLSREKSYNDIINSIFIKANFCFSPTSSLQFLFFFFPYYHIFFYT